ncbi:MAG: hypothetical protein AB4062_18740 [Crocosphaera sp.]
MEPITTIATTITTLIFGEALKEGGKRLGKSSSEKIAQLTTVIRERFKKSGTEGLLIRAEKKPTDSNIAIVEGELVTQMSDDDDGEVFVQQLKEQLKQLEQLGITRNVMLTGIKGKKLELEGDLTQEATKGGSVEQIMASDLEIDGEIKIRGNLTQKTK